MIELRSRNIDRGEMAPNCLSHSLTTLGREGILLWGRQKRHWRNKNNYEVDFRCNSCFTYPGPSREGSRIVVHVLGALKVAHCKHTRLVVEGESPIPNGLTTVAVKV